MNNDIFQHYLTQLIEAANSHNLSTLMEKLDLFQDLSLSQQLELASAAERDISSTQFIKIYKAVVAKNSTQVRMNPVLRKLTKKKFLSDLNALREVVETVDISNPRTIEYVSGIIKESDSKELELLWSDRIKKDSTAPENEKPIQLSRTEMMNQIKELGDEKTPESVAKLLKLAHTDVGFDIIIINLLMRDGSDEAILATVSFLSSPSTRVRHYAITKLEECREKAIPSLITQLKRSLIKKQNDTAIAILGVLKTIGTREIVPELRTLFTAIPEIVNVRVSYIETLAELGPVITSPYLVEQICDGVDDLAYSAAHLIEKQCVPEIITGIKNILTSNLISVERLVEVLVFASCPTVIKNLRDLQAFDAELIRRCSEPGMENYIAKYSLEINGIKSVLLSPEIWAVDDSRMIQRMYQHFGVEHSIKLKTFDEGSELLQALDGDDKPALIFIDLNMPNISGIDVAKGVIEQGYPMIPRVLVTTQSDAELDPAMQRELFSEVIQKPFDSDILKKLADKYVAKDQ